MKSKDYQEGFEEGKHQGFQSALKMLTNELKHSLKEHPISPNVRDGILCTSVDSLLLNISEICVARYNVEIIFDNGDIWQFERKPKK